MATTWRQGTEQVAVLSIHTHVASGVSAVVQHCSQVHINRVKWKKKKGDGEMLCFEISLKKKCMLPKYKHF